ncbi:DUF55-domain-containing protein [Boletus edulis BED1]|uniref:DUF55-domain-containing protein n=1 Tax=Boletus edulis BED1 TaxID=1328754 RepID=A0AAD4GL22_BOLED|nr:DUF55-domain-containing protein [Boletus edulis BED1]
MKAEPDSRVVKGKDVKFSIDDFEGVESTPWEGVRNYEARNLMKEMVLGDKVLFYHSNCKNPGIAGFAEVSKEAYPDQITVLASKHPYFDAKSDREHPRWFMVDVKFISRARNFVPLSLLRHLADLSSAIPPEALGYVGQDGINEIKAMPLITRGRLSVQRVSAKCWDVIQTMAEQGGWDNISFEKKKVSKTRHPVDGARPTTRHQRMERLADDAIRDDEPEEQIIDALVPSE